MSEKDFNELNSEVNVGDSIKNDETEVNTPDKESINIATVKETDKKKSNLFKVTIAILIVLLLLLVAMWFIFNSSEVVNNTCGLCNGAGCWHCVPLCDNGDCGICAKCVENYVCDACNECGGCEDCLNLDSNILEELEIEQKEPIEEPEPIPEEPKQTEYGGTNQSVVNTDGKVINPYDEEGNYQTYVVDAEKVNTTGVISVGSIKSGKVSSDKLNVVARSISNNGDEVTLKINITNRDTNSVLINNPKGVTVNGLAVKFSSGDVTGTSNGTLSNGKTATIELKFNCDEFLNYGIDSVEYIVVSGISTFNQKDGIENTVDNLAIKTSRYTGKFDTIAIEGNLVAVSEESSIQVVQSPITKSEDSKLSLPITIINDSEYNLISRIYGFKINGVNANINSIQTDILAGSTNFNKIKLGDTIKLSDSIEMDISMRSDDGAININRHIKITVTNAPKVETPLE